MVRAILAGTKTQTRRIVKHLETGEPIKCPDLVSPSVPCPYGQPGDRIWVKETWAAWDSIDDREASEVDGTAQDLADQGITQAHISYRADTRTHADRWRSSIYMPRWASRITLEIVSVRAERLNSITESDCFAEGIEVSEEGTFHPDNPTGTSAVRNYELLWNSINGPDSWDFNPWVWRIEFKRA